ncbi:MAG: VTT domain-containing protein [Syntrophomonadaceae bacterium]|nr:VTT domain-containing protein [Syntrophomonadaceae bacterium]MDD3888998.1 VTT domain-containing protein [Syntrophomonadaceae bacterium]MDD4548303.1 VTT domain-containing protein [Syntrophomonadaceae bacterium]
MFSIQATAPAIPYMILAGAAGMIFGRLIGFLLAWVGALSGACFLYWISGTFGKEYFTKKLKKRFNFDIRKIEDKNIFLLLLISRIFPVVPTPVINVGSGVSGVPFWIFFSASALGKIPWAIIYVSMGNYLIKTQNIINTLTMIGAIFLISFLGISYFRKKILK